jgi:magnesium transporter
MTQANAFSQQGKFFLALGLDENVRQSLEQDFQIEELDIEDVFTNTQLSKIERRKNYLYVALQFPEYDKANQTFISKEVHTFLSHNFLLVVDKNEFKYCERFKNLLHRLVEDPEDHFEVFYEMVDFIITNIFRVIGKFREDIVNIEKDLFSFEKSQDNLKEILIVKKNLINFMSTLTPLESALTDLQSRKISLIDEEGKEMLDDSLDKIKKMLNNLRNFKEQLTLLTETNESLISRSTNQTLQVLTSISLIAVVPTFLASFFGMNVYFGWEVNQESWWPLIGIITIIALITLLLWHWFRQKGWV